MTSVEPPNHKGVSFMETEQQQKKIVVMNSDIINDKELTPSEKLVYARICFFDEFFEQAEATAEYLNISTDKVKRAKQKLEKLGYIVCVTNTGRGKKYIARLDNYGNTRRVKTTNQTSKKAPIRRVKKTNIDKKELRTNKEHIDTSVSMETASQKDEYGNEEINALFQAFRHATGLSINANIKKNRRYAHLLIKKHGFRPMIAVMSVVAMTQDDQYAPRIKDFESLHFKWNDIALWYKQKTQAKPNLVDLSVQANFGTEISLDDL